MIAEGRPPAEGGVHVESALIAAYLDHELKETERERVERHLADCRTCRDELAEVLRLVEPRERSRSAGWWVAGGAAVAAILAAVLLVQPGDSPDTSPVFRAGEAQERAEEAPGIEVLAPPENAVLAPDSLGFAWREVEPGALYRFTLADAQGDVVWTDTTGETTVRVPPEVGIDRDRDYYWYVDALLSEGRSATSGIRRFTSRP